MNRGLIETAFAEASTALTSTSVLRCTGDLTDEEFGRLLIQRRFVSLAFTPFYDMLIDGLQNPRARLVCRQVLREEYPDAAGNAPSHRELLVADLVALGLDVNVLLLSRPTPATAQSIASSFGLIWSALESPCRELALVCTAACYAEYLVAAEYSALKPRIDEAMAMEDSVFYGPHLLHDSGHFKRLLEEVVLGLDETDPRQLRSCTDAVKRCLEVKLTFYDQFVSDVQA
jgi:hypothetical protein